MLIRSQDKKTLTKFESVSISNKYKRNAKGDRDIIGYKVFASYGDTTDFVVGEYSTEEKAVKVLDMIMKHYDKVMDARHWNDEYQENYFIMPSDEEVN